MVKRTTVATSVEYKFCQEDLPKLDVQSLDKQSATKQVQALMLCFSREMVAIFLNLDQTEDQTKDPAVIITALQRYIEGHVNETNQTKKSLLPGTIARGVI